MYQPFFPGCPFQPPCFPKIPPLSHELPSPVTDWTNDTINPQPKFLCMLLVLALFVCVPPVTPGFFARLQWPLVEDQNPCLTNNPESMTVKIAVLQSNSTFIVGFCESYPSNCHHLRRSSQTLATAKLWPIQKNAAEEALLFCCSFTMDACSGSILFFFWAVEFVIEALTVAPVSS